MSPLAPLRPRRVDLELLASVERASEDVVVSWVLPRVLLPCEEVISSDRLVLTDPGSAEQDLRGRGPGVRGAATTSDVSAISMQESVATQVRSGDQPRPSVGWMASVPAILRSSPAGSTMSGQAPYRREGGSTRGKGGARGRDAA